MAVIILAVSAVVIAPVRPAPPPEPTPTVRLVALAQTTTSTVRTGPSVPDLELPELLVWWLERIVVPPSARAPFPSPNFPNVVGGNSIDSAIKNVYNAIEPWVEWGFDVAAYAVGWIPYVGWLAPQIEIFYNFGERIVQSITFNIADWLGGNISFWDGLVRVAVDTINSFIFLANDQLAFWLPPLPPIPPIGPFAAEAAEAGIQLSALDETNLPEAKVDQEDELDDGVKDFDETLTQRQGIVQQGVSEFEGEVGGELSDVDGAQLEQVPGTEKLEGEPNADGLTEGAEPELNGGPELELDGEKELTTTTTTDTRATTTTVQAQGEIRASAIATPIGTTNPQTTDGSVALDAKDDLEAAAPQPPSAQAPSPNAAGDLDPQDGTDQNSAEATGSAAGTT
ncbi:hypothetical protein AU197_20650 [Mycobacterium sp. IS-1590]|uniref:hypothetical protein n=1 Tax=Mycobacterium sp. IS-1590 TaxID=1772286 RepID=UPI00074B0F42|nr:hypothetical protein [Mycobacterium sp. IS-1590]KUI33713.1 hypothetical protein AU197_20650 [Mycobacterium sp. IS-1590]